MSEQFAVISHFNEGNEVVINRYVNMWGITLEMLVQEANQMILIYNRKFGKRFGYCHNYEIVDNKAYKKIENNLVVLK